MEEINYYETDDMAFATFLKARGIELLEIRLAEQTTDFYSSKCVFVFVIDKDDEYLQEIMHEWANTEYGRDIQQILILNRYLKKQIKDFLINLQQVNSRNIPPKFVRKTPYLLNNSSVDRDKTNYNNLQL